MSMREAEVSENLVNAVCVIPGRVQREVSMM